MSTQNLKFEQLVKASPTQVFYAFTNATALREWLCDTATVVPQPGGRVYMAWNGGYYTCGEYTKLEPGKEIAFTWYGRNEPGPTQVSLSLSEKESGTLVELTHHGVGTQGEWSQTIQQIQDGWRDGLDNLASVLESGEDQRFTLRPMLGILVSDFTPEHAKALGVPVTEGIRLDNVVDGMGAQAAGLQSDDIIVGMAGKEANSFQTLTNALQGKRAGDQVEVVFYRGIEKKTTSMELSKRPIPEIPETIQGLAKTLQQRDADQEAELDEFFAGVSEEEASFKRAPDEWSIKEVLAHLIQGERFISFRIAELVGGQERRADDYAGNLEAWIKATVSTYPTLQELLDELKRCHAENLALYGNLPEEFLERKGSYWRLTYEALEGPYHFHSHLDQMRASIAAARAQ